jgi:hypothetical protein
VGLLYMQDVKEKIRWKQIKVVVMVALRKVVALERWNHPPLALQVSRTSLWPGIRNCKV